jgi:hypothetical protein
MKFPSISLGRVSKSYTHDMSFDNNTTYPFGVVQPLMSQRLDANSHLSVNIRQLIRLAPMPVPTFARLFSNNEVSFVPTVEVCPYYEAFLSQLSYKGTSQTFYPTKLPVVSNSLLLWLLLNNSDFCWWSAFDANGTLIRDYTSKLTSWSQALQTALFKKAYYPQLQDDSILNSKDNFVSIASADFKFLLDNPDSTKVVLAFKLSPAGRRVRTNILGLGYSLNADPTPVSMIPLLSYYKAWFDLYAPVRLLSWTDTLAFQLVRFIEDYIWDFSIPQQNTSFPVFEKFFNLLSETFFVAKDDIVSVHRAEIVTTPGTTMPFSPVDGIAEPYDSLGRSQHELPQLLDGGDGFSLITLQALQRFTRYFSKNSVIGRRISEYIKVHYGASVASSLYKDANHVHSFTYPLSVDDIMSTSDTFEVTGDTSKGELLGSYGGKGIGFDKSSFEFTAPSDGYLFVLGSISTPTGYFQGNNGDLYVIDFDTTPLPDFDALGYEVSPVGQFFGDNGVLPSQVSPHKGVDFTAGFGYVPRFTGLKYHKNIVNGDISRPSTADSLSAYHLNRIVTPYLLEQTSLDTSGNLPVCKYKFTSTDVPKASIAWRYLSQYEWLGNYNRIFYNEGDLLPFNRYPTTFGDDDKFIVQTVFESKLTNKLKSLSTSWDTYEESTDDGSVDVSPE